jgi:hypothetical protein
MAKGAYYHFKSTLNHIRFVMERNKLLSDTLTMEEQIQAKKTIRSILDDETETVLNVLKIRSEDSRIGFEASNHYFYTVQDLKEKIINLHYLKEYYA